MMKGDAVEFLEPTQARRAKAHDLEVSMLQVKKNLTLQARVMGQVS